MQEKLSERVAEDIAIASSIRREPEKNGVSTVARELLAPLDELEALAQSLLDAAECPISPKAEREDRKMMEAENRAYRDAYRDLSAILKKLRGEK